MALRNAFENLSTEEKQDAILDMLAELISRLNRQPATLPYSRDSVDRMRVAVDTSATVGVQASRPPNQDVSGNQLTWYGQAGGVVTMDYREVYEQSTRMEFQNKRARWTIT